VGSLLQFNWLPRLGTVTVKDFFFLWLAGVFYPIGLIPWDRLKLEGNRVAGDWRKNKDKEKNPVLLIHGYFHNGSAYLLLKHRLEKAGWRHVYSINLSSKKTIEQSAERLAEDVEKILHQTGAHRVDVIAHSMGGLVARYYVQFLEGYKKVERCVTLACPNQGTELYLFAVTPCGRQLNPRGQFITKINQDNLDKLRYIYTASVWSAYDLMILPSEYARWPQDTADIAIDSVGHWGLLYSSEVFETLQKLLAEKSKLPALRVVRPNVA
jgi:triacylglycerol esterase/lipase EstA (alpha/beta hydrolase family)